jgi:hypothetical protein
MGLAALEGVAEGLSMMTANISPTVCQSSFASKENVTRCLSYQTQESLPVKDQRAYHLDMPMHNHFKFENIWFVYNETMQFPFRNRWGVHWFSFPQQYICT